MFSDIHGNWDSFKVIKNRILSEGADQNLYAGDICGYYYEQDSVIQGLQEIPNLRLVSGNHDRDFLKFLDEGNARKEAIDNRSFDLLAARASKETIQFIRDLPLYVREDQIMLVHGSPWNYLDEYIYPDSNVERFADLQERYVFMGHTHHPMHRISGSVVLVNPGSCGQPRDHWQPSYAVIDTATGKVDFKRVEYDRQKLLRKIEQIEPENVYLRNILFREANDAR